MYIVPHWRGKHFELEDFSIGGGPEGNEFQSTPTWVFI
jgi:hypothetical protein